MIDINDRFKEALRLMEKTGQSLFITGKAGTGKSTLLSHFCKVTDKKPVVLAPTGVAALNVKGQTIHNFFNFYVDVTPQKIREKKSKPRRAKLYKKLKTIIIDEVSMVRADLLDCVDAFLRLYGPDPGKAFGGVQMIFIGDLYQLPPVVSSNERELFTTHYKTPYFFSAHALKDTPLEVVELEKVYRQKDPTFINLLNKIRNNSVEDADIKLLNSRHGKTDAPKKKKGFFITLTTTNARADEINATHLDALKGKAHCAEAEIKGEFGKEYFPTATELRFKPGAQIMMLNNDTNKRWVNGSIGVIEAVKKDIDDEEYLQVRLEDDDDLAEVYPHSWEVYRFGVEGDTIISEPIGTFTQYPFRLAWAITIHKSQGKTFGNVTIDIGRGTFAAGQMYVALSRCTSFEGIILKVPIGKQNIRTDYRIFEFLTGHQYRKAATALPRERKIALIKAAINGKKLLDIVYLKGNDTKTKRTIRPLSLKDEEFKGKTFLGMRALCTLREEERIFSVDRILEVKETQTTRRPFQAA